MTNEANIFYKPLRQVSFFEGTGSKKEAMPTAESTGMHVVSMNCEEPAKLAKTPRLKVCDRFSLILIK